MKDFNITSDDDEIKKIMSDDNFVFFLGMIFPRRPGVALFAVKLEYLYFPPNTEKSREFICGQNMFGGTIWIIVGIPKEKMHLAERIAKECGLRIADGVPHVISKEGSSSFFLDRENIFSLENLTGHPVYDNNPSINQDLIKIEDQEIDEIIRNPEEYRKKIKEKPIPKKIDIEWDKE